MYRIDRNNYHKNPKTSNIQTPLKVSWFIYELLTSYFLPEKGKPVLDPCYGQGNLLKPWQKTGYPTYGVEITENNKDPVVLIQDFLTWNGIDVFQYRVQPQLVICNPPFNGYKGKCSAEIWLDKIIELFGKEIPIVLFAPYNFRLPWKKDSKRLGKFLSGKYPPISSIISLPTKGLWEKVIFHSEILIFNLPNLQPHYFYHETS